MDRYPKAASIANKFFKLSGLTYLLSGQKTGAMSMMARWLGSMIDREHGELPPETQRALLQYDISPRDWDRLRQAPGHPELSNGRTVLTPDAALRAAPEADLLGKDAFTAAERDKLALKLHAYYSDVADRGIITPGIGEKAILLQGTAPGTVLGELTRFVAQFKQWPLAAVRQGFGREWNGGNSTLAAVGGILHIAAASMVVGTAINAITDAFKGRSPRPLTDPRTLIAGMMKGGGIGILGDYLFGEFNRFGQNPAEAFLGPVLGTSVSTILDVWNKMKAEATDPSTTRKHDVRPELLRAAVDHTPFINLFYVRSALNYLFLSSAQEALSPGYLRRSEQRLQRDQGQHYWLAPSQNHLRTFGR